MRWVWDLTREIDIDVRPREPVEIKLIPTRGINVAARIMAETWKGYLTERGALEFLSGLPPSSQVFPFVAFRGGRPIGSVVAVLEYGVGELCRGVHVLPEFRRRHVGKALLLHALRYLQGRGARKAFVVRQMQAPLSEDDVAASCLYDGAGGVRRPPLVEMVYTPQCPWTRQFLVMVRDWLLPYDVTVEEVSMWDRFERAGELLLGSGLAEDRGGRLALKANVFLKVFVDGVFATGMPPDRDQLYHRLERLGGRKHQDRSPVPDEVVRFGQPGYQTILETSPQDWAAVPLKQDRFHQQVALCLDHHPSGWSATGGRR